MLSLALVLFLSQAGAASTPPDAPTNDQAQLTAPPPAPRPADANEDWAHANAPKRSARLFSEPRVGTGVLIGRMGMGLLFGGGAAALGGAAMVVAAYATSSTPVLVTGVLLTAALVGLGTALGAAMFGNDYGHDFVDALTVAMVTGLAGALLFAVGYFVPVLLYPLLAVSMGLMVVGVPLFVQVFKAKDDGPEATVALLRF
jgi:hypothetical protein